MSAPDAGPALLSSQPTTRDRFARVACGRQATMTHLDTTNARNPGTDMIAATIARHGAGAVLVAALVALIRPPPRAIPLARHDLSDHLRRDIGLASARPARATRRP